MISDLQVNFRSKRVIAPRWKKNSATTIRMGNLVCDRYRSLQRFQYVMFYWCAFVTYVTFGAHKLLDQMHEANAQ